MKKIVLLVLISLSLWFAYWKLLTPGYLTFSDGAKIADIARNVAQGHGYGSSFSSFGADKDVLEHSRQFPFPAFGRQPMMSLFMAAAFRLFGTSDFVVVATSGFFYLLLVITVFLVGRKLFSDLVGFLSALAIAVNPNFLDYATSGASETLFTFEIVLAALLFLKNTKKYTILGFLVLFFSYLTRPQAFLFIWGFALFVLLLSVKKAKKVFTWMTVITALGILFDYLVLSKLTGKTFLYSVLSKGAGVSVLYSSAAPATGGLRSVVDTKSILVGQWTALLKKGFYNLYNFYKLLPQIMSPYMFALFLIGLFKWGKNRVENSLKITTIFMVVASFLVTALTFPFFRYIHPVIPFVYLFAIATLVWMVEKMVKKQRLVLVSTLLILFFVIGQTLGVIFLDSRFKAARTNKGRPPVYAALSKTLKENTQSDEVIITNLDTWGSWYGQRRTIWFPLSPSQLVPDKGEEIAFDAIYLTSYLIDDENYYMGDEWREIFYNPESLQDKFIRDNFKLEGIYEISANDTYEKESARAILLVRR